MLPPQRCTTRIHSLRGWLYMLPWLNLTKCIHNTLLSSDNLESSFFQAVDWLDLCGCNGINLHPQKFQFGQDTATFAGFEITNNSVKPFCKFLDVFAGFTTPRNIHDITSWFCLINQVSYAFASLEKLQSFRHLLQPNTFVEQSTRWII